MRKPHRRLKAHFCCFNVFCFLPFQTLCNVIGSDLFFCKSNLDLNADVRHFIFLSFSLYLQFLPFSAKFYSTKQFLYEIALFPLSCLFLYFVKLTICAYFCHTLDIERRARMALPSTWSICCFMGQTPLLKMPQGTLHFTFLPCTTR